MQKSLVIVESPAKAHTSTATSDRTISSRPRWGISGTCPKSTLGVDVKHDFAPHYVVIPDRKKTVPNSRRRPRKRPPSSWPPTGPRGGSHLLAPERVLLKESNPNIRRVLLNEITKKAVEDAFEHQGAIDEDKIRAQQARRILDRLVGYLISPLLWRKIGKGLSAGRVQSIALRLICEREKEIRAFVSEEYWTIAARLEASEPPPFKASLVKMDGKKAKIGDAAGAQAAVDELKQVPFLLEDVKIQEKKTLSGSPLYHQHSPAGRVPAASISGQKDDGRRPEAL